MGSLEIARNWTEELEEEVEKVFKVLQTFDPPGIFSRDLKECLLIQAKILNLERQ